MLITTHEGLTSKMKMLESGLGDAAKAYDVEVPTMEHKNLYN